MKVLVIGGGYSGLTTIVGLRKKDKTVEIVLVEPKDHMEVVWASYRSAFDEKIGQQSLLDLPTFCTEQKVSHVKALVTGLTDTSATLSNGDTVDFDLCVVAVGAAAPWAGIGRSSTVAERKTTVQDRQAEMKEEGDKLLNATNVLIVGGGLIGVELAGDVAYYKQENNKPGTVTLVHSGSHVINEWSDKAAGMVTKKLKSLKNLKLILNDRVVEEDGTYKLQSSGEALPEQPDQVVMTVGFSPINSFMDASMLDDKGYVKVDEFFRVEGSNGKIFALGDCEATQLYNAGAAVLAQQGIIGNNLKVTLNALEKDGASADLSAVKLKPLNKLGLQGCVTVGRKQGVLFASGFVTQRIIPGIKNSTMFIMKPKSDLKIKNFA
mmetsp:Transcript_10303/g.22668  ORF Transcript_10303/g.22668 Transcript_10303/m.22668 type:complete len:379 (+) Transcript_10303:132-1268(+)